MNVSWWKEPLVPLGRKESLPSTEIWGKKKASPVQLLIHTWNRDFISLIWERWEVRNTQWTTQSYWTLWDSMDYSAPASLPFTNPQSFLRSVMPSNHFVLCCPLLLASIQSYPEYEGPKEFSFFKKFSSRQWLLLMRNWLQPIFLMHLLSG